MQRTLLVGIVLALVASMVPSGVVGSHTPAHNNPPSLVATADVAGAEDGNILLTFTASDPDGDDIVIEMVGTPSGAQFWQDSPTTAQFDWTPDFSQSGFYTLTVKARDEYVGVQDSFNITVANTNRAPDFPFLNDEFMEELELINKQWAVTDPDGDPVALTLESDVKDTLLGLPAGMGFSDSGGGNGALAWTPSCSQGALPWPGAQFHFWANATDGSLSSTREFDIWVEDVNTAPTILPIMHHVADEGDFLSFTINVTSCDPGDVHFAEIGFVSATETGIVPPPLPEPWPNQALPVGASADPEFPLPMHYDPVSGHNYTFFNWTIGAQQAGSYDFYAHVVDAAGLEDNATFSVFVNLTNTPPMISIPAFHVPAQELYYSKEDTAFYATAPLNLVTDTWTAFAVDLEDDEVEWQLDMPGFGGIQLPAGMTISHPGPPVPASLSYFTISWIPGYTQAGNYSFDLTLTDYVNTTHIPFNISVENTNRLPSIDFIPNVVIPEGEFLDIEFLGQELDFLDATFPDYIELSADDCFGGAIPPGSDFHDPHMRQGTFFGGTLEWTPSYFAAGSYCVRIIADDSDADVVDPANPLCCPLIAPPPSNPVETFTITVLNVDRAPSVVIPCAPQTVKYGFPVLTSFKFKDVDFDPIVLSIDPATPLPGFLGLIDLGTGAGSLSGTPALADIGRYTINVNATSGPLALVAQVTCIITVVAEADFTFAPVGSNVVSTTPGVPMVVKATVTNLLLSSTDTFTFTASVSEGGSAILPGAVTLGPGDSTIVDITVTVPVGEEDFIAKIFATSTLDLSHSEQAGFIMRVPVFTTTIMTNTLPLPSVTGLTTAIYLDGSPAVGIPVTVEQTPSADLFGLLATSVIGFTDAAGLFAFDFGTGNNAGLPGPHDIVVTVNPYFGGPEVGTYGVPV